MCALLLGCAAAAAAAASDAPDAPGTPAAPPPPASARAPRVRNGLFYAAANVTGSFQVWAFTAAGRRLHQVSSGLALAAHPAASPDGKRVAYSGYDSALRSWDVYVAPAASGGGGGQARLTNGTGGLAMVPAWSPDGGRVAFESDRDDATGTGLTQVYVMDALPGAPATRMTFSAQNDMGECSGGQGVAGASAAFRGWVKGLVFRLQPLHAGGKLSPSAARLPRHSSPPLPARRLVPLSLPQAPSSRPTGQHSRSPRTAPAPWGAMISTSCPRPPPARRRGG
jgi:hypothetical protein